MSIATFESPQVASQQFFPWVFDEEDCGFSDTRSSDDCLAEAHVACQPLVTTPFTAHLATETRLGIPVRLGAVMLKLLKSYGITDEEIAEGMAVYAAKAGLAQAS